MRRRAPTDVGPRIPPDLRLVELATAGLESWFRIHVGDATSCGCGLQGPDDGCDVGLALDRLALAARAGKLDRHKAAA